MLIIIANKISKKSLLDYVTEFIDYCKTALKNKDNDENNIKEEFKELLLKHVEKN